MISLFSIYIVIYIKMVEKTVEYMQDNNHKVTVDNYDGSNKVSIWIFIR